MKKIFTLFFALCLTSLMAQVTMNPGTLSAVISEEVNEHVYNVTVTNTGSSAVQVWWRVGKANFPSAWTTYMCDINQCYVPGLEDCPASKPNNIAAGQTATFTFHFDPNGTIGTGKIWIQLFSDKSFKTLLTETDKNATVVADRLLSSKNITTGDIKVFPNPTADYFNVKNDAGVVKVGIYNIVGKEIDTYRHVSGNSYNVSDYTNGLYIVRLIDSKGKTLKSIRLTKR